MRDRVALIVLTVLVAAACSGGDASTATTAATTPADVAVSSPSTTGAPAAPGTSVATDPSAPSTIPATTSATLPPAEPYPVGVVWDGPVEVLSQRSGVDPDSFRLVALDDELWVFGDRWNGSIAARSNDGGATWSEVVIVPPSTDGSTRIDHLLRSADGRYLAVARSTTCRGGVAAEDGFGVAGACTRHRPVVFTSDDGATWTESAPGGLTPPGDASLEIVDVIAADPGFLAVGTIKGPDWRAALFSSPDGTAWTNERELVGAANPYSARSLAYDGTTLTVTVDETPCSQLRDNTSGGWVLGAWWAKHGRIYTGSDIASLTLQQPGEHPLAPEPNPGPDDCGLVDDVPFQSVPYPKFDAMIVDGVTTIFERYVPAEQSAAVEAADEAIDEADDEDEAVAALEEIRSNSGTRRYAQLADGAWVVTDIEGVNVLDATDLNDGAETTDQGSYIVGVGAEPAFVQVRRAAYARWDVFTVTDADPSQTVSIAPLVLNEPSDVIAVDDGYLLLAGRQNDPFRPYRSDDPVAIVVWRTSVGEGSLLPTCDLVAGGSCVRYDLSEHPEYPDFSGRDLAGVDLSGSDLGSANFDGTDLSGARLWLAEGDRDEPPSFVGADLTGAELQRSWIGDISNAVVAGANLRDASVADAVGVDFSSAVVVGAELGGISGATFGDTDLSGAELVVVDAFPDLAGLTYDRIRVSFDLGEDDTLEVDLSGVDLTDVTLIAPSPSAGDRPQVIVTGLDAASLVGTRFQAIDLSPLDPAIDLGELQVDSNTICPDGAPSTGGFFGTCSRDEF